MSIYPSVLTPLGAARLIEGIDENLWFTSPDGESKFYLKGGMSPLAPGVPGQDGIICTSHSGMSAPFKHKDLEGAHQDGVTWTETVYDPALITLNLEAHASTPQGLTRVVDEWMGAWNPRQPGTLEWITPDGGYWYSGARLVSTWQDDIKYDRRYLYRPITHKCRLDDAFWLAPDSTDTFPPIVEEVTDDFSVNHASGLGSNWTTTYSSSHTMTEYVQSGQVLISDAGNSTQWVRNLYNAADTAGDFQVITITLGTTWPAGTGGPFTMIARWNGTSTYIECRVTSTDVTVTRYNAGTPTVIYTHPLHRAPRRRETWAFAAGIDLGEPRSYALYRGANQVFGFSEFGTGSAVGSSYRKTGFELGTVAGATTELLPPPVSLFDAADNIGVANQQWYVALTNIGTEDAYPQYTCVGPGTFLFEDGPGSGSYVTLGPLGYGQVVQITTLPRLRTVVDVTNPTNNVYSLLNGRFTTPIAGVSIPSQATPQLIGVAISGGSAASQIFASLTPQRIHPA